MLLNDLLLAHDIDPKTVLAMRHRPWEPQLNKVLPWLASERPELFNAYQQTQNERVEKAMRGAKYVASFIGHEPGKAMFIGLYSVEGFRPMNRKEFWANEHYIVLKTYGLNGFSEDEPRESVLWFDLGLCDFYAEWKGRLIVGWPGPERSWWRWANRNEIRVLAITEESQLERRMPDWDEINLTWADLKVLPRTWKSALHEWRGVYFIFDSSDGKAYVGSAYGKDNLLGRWLDYAARGHGGNRYLRTRDPSRFQFSILQRVSPDMEPNDVLHLEASWKQRLHTRHPFGLNDN